MIGNHKLVALFLLSLSLLYSAQGFTISFNLVYPGVSTPDTQYFQVQINDVNAGSQMFLMTTLAPALTIHNYVYTTATEPSEANIQYQYIFQNNTDVLTEGFLRKLESCRVLTISGDAWIIQNEYFNQSQLYLGFDALPLLSENANGIPPAYYDDNQVVTFNFDMSQASYDELWTLETDENYVPCNMSFTSLTLHSYLTDIRIRRAGGYNSLLKFPYSFQVAMTDEMNLGGPDRVFKLKAYPLDYENSNPSAGILYEKMAADLTYALGAPVNYVSICRVFVNHVDQGLYGLIEKVDEEFIQRRWPYIGTSHVGTLYKAQNHFSITLDNAWTPSTLDFLEHEARQNSYCCPCYEADCSVKAKSCNNNPDCAVLNCCWCSWEDNGALELDSADCTTQDPFEDFIPLGNSILNNTSSDIAAYLNTDLYLKGIAAELGVMNADGYVYNSKNYYWYRDSVSGKFILILYDQDITFSNPTFFTSNLGVYNWTYSNHLTDGLFLVTLLQDANLYNAYTTVVTNMVQYLCRYDEDGPFFQRMNALTDFIVEFNPQRRYVENRNVNFYYFVTELSKALAAQLDITLPPLNPQTTGTCG